MVGRPAGNNNLIKKLSVSTAMSDVHIFYMIWSNEWNCCSITYNLTKKFLISTTDMLQVANLDHGKTVSKSILCCYNLSVNKVP